MKTLYVSDLDGTLLNNNAQISGKTKGIINDLIFKGMYFTYATARSFSSAINATNCLNLELPVIVHNGTFIIDSKTKEKLLALYFTDDEKNFLIDSLDKHSINPVVYGNIENAERISWLLNKENDGIKKYLDWRKGDNRLRPIKDKTGLFCGELYCIICIGKKQELEKFYEFLEKSAKFYCTFQQEFYTGEYWCEIMPKKATKGNAIKILKEEFGFDKLITFGDAVNDIPMFEISDESYAVENGADELKKYATGIIPSNTEDGVAEWLKNNYCKM